MIALQGTGVSPGVASGKLYYYKRDTKDVECYTITDTTKELDRLQNAVKSIILR